MSRRSLSRAAVLLVCLITGMESRTAVAQFFSPGPLARSHASLEGLDKCAKCHESEKGLSARLCLDCHTELKGRVAKGSGFHGRLAPAKRDECQACHPDHRGLDFTMIDWEGSRDKFDHKKTGWPLKGGHASPKVKCDDCHQRPLIGDVAVRRMLDQQPKRQTHLGLLSRCDGCHFDEHRSQLGRECQKCHDEEAWKPPRGFDHQKLAFPLLGKHKEVACAKCHPSVPDQETHAGLPKPRATIFMQMKPIAFKTCESCHEDPHKGSLGPACASCHSEAGWRIIKANKDQDTHFHDKTRFPLRGGHIGVNCRSCHGPFPGQAAKFKGLAFGRCGDCHVDAHMGQLASKPPAKTPDCDVCHTVASFARVKFEREQHADTKFPLEGGHAVAACAGCHPQDATLARRIPAATRTFLKTRKRPEQFSLAVLRPEKSVAACSGCHADVHLGQFKTAKRETNATKSPDDARSGDVCSTCHKVTSFADLRFDHGKDSRFPLSGKHAETACSSCHRSERVPGTRQTAVRYKPLPISCGACHDDVHQGQFTLTARARTQERAAARVTRDCDTCHVTKSFKETLFDHNDARFTTYALDGKHAKVACARCHPKVHVSAGVETVRYVPLPRVCEACHVDFHHGEFRGFEP